MRRRTLLALAAAATPAMAQQPQQQPQLSLRQIPVWMEMAAVPGLWLTVISRGRIVRASAFGSRDTKSGEALQDTTLFELASLTKQLTAYVAHSVRKEGKLDFDKPLNDYIGPRAEPGAKGRTARHVLAHGAGFPNWRGKSGEPLTPEFEPLARFRYSGEGYVYLTRAIEKITGQPFGELIHARIFDPLGMTNSAVARTPDLEPRMAPGHDSRGNVHDTSFRRRFWDNAAKTMGATPPRSWTYEDCEAVAKAAGLETVPNAFTPNYAASICATGPDYARFLQQVLADTSALMTFETTMRESADWKIGWGLGWGVEHIRRRNFLWQWGDNRGFKNFVLIEPQGRRAWAVLTNGDAGRNVYEKIITGATGLDHPALLWQ